MLWLRFQLRDLGRLTVRLFDVGQGDAVLITSPSGRQIIVDGGPDNTLLHKLGPSMPVWDREIELLVVTHPHADHFVGLIELLRRYRVAQVMLPSQDADTPEYQAFVRELRRQAVPVLAARRPFRQQLEPGMELRLLYAPETPQQNPNDASLVLQLAFGDFGVLLTGDLEAEAQAQLPQPFLPSVVLKVPHHGSRDALNVAVWEMVAPQLAVISVGKNTYGHPSVRVRRALERLGAEVLATQEAGDIVVVSDGRRTSVDASKLKRHLVPPPPQTPR